MHVIRLKHVETDRLRELVSANLERILEPGTSARTDVDCGAECLLAERNTGGRTLVSFDMHDANQALLRGLVALDRIARHEDEWKETPDLLILSPEAPAGKCLLSRLRGFTWRPFEVIQVDDRLGLLLEAPDDPPRDRPGTLHRDPAPEETGRDGLTPEEESFFQHL